MDVGNLEKGRNNMKKKWKKIILLILGIIFLLAPPWVVSYIFAIVESEHWVLVPSMVSAIIVMFIGFRIICLGITEYRLYLAGTNPKSKKVGY